MADDLDDFFARKDRAKKSKGKKKSQPDELQPPVDAVQPEKVEVSDEWKDYEEKKAPDYTGLKVTALNTFNHHAEEPTSPVVTERREERDDDPVIEGPEDHEQILAAKKSTPYKISSAAEQKSRVLSDIAFPTLAAASQSKISEREAREFQEVKSTPRSAASSEHWQQRDSSNAPGVYRPPALRENFYNALSGGRT